MPVPHTPTTAERLTKLEAETATLKMQHRAALNSLQALAESVHALVESTAATQARISTLDETWRARLIRQAVQMAMDFDGDPNQPSWEDVWEVDQSKTDLNLTFRVEDVVLDG